MSRYIKVEDAIETAIDGCAKWDGGYSPSMDKPIKEEFETVDDKCIEIVRCRDCKHRGFHRALNCIGDVRTDFPENSKCPMQAALLIMPDDFYCKYGERKEKGYADS